jgi:hypothetical protein
MDAFNAQPVVEKPTHTTWPDRPGRAYREVTESVRIGGVVELTLHSTGSLTAMVRGACVTTHATSRLSAEELIRRKTWWADFGRSFTAKVQREDSDQPVMARTKSIPVTGGGKAGPQCRCC